MVVSGTGRAPGSVSVYMPATWPRSLTSTAVLSTRVPPKEGSLGPSSVGTPVSSHTIARETGNQSSVVA